MLNSPLWGDLIMKWTDIKKQYPDKFILLGDIVEKRITGNQSKILEASILEIRDTGNDIMQAYRRYKEQGKDVLYSLPTTPKEFIVRNVAFKGVFR